MIKKVKIEFLRPGMFVHDFNCGWLENPFFQNSILLSSERMVEKVIRQGIREVYIDTQKGLDIAEAIPEEEVKKKIQFELKKVVDTAPEKVIEVPALKEIKEAKNVQSEAKKIVHNIMDDVKLGKQIEVEKVTPVVEKITDSIFRNKDALTSLGRIKRKHEYTFLHSVNVCALMVSFSRTLGHDRKTINDIGVGALLHDVGKMKVPMEILNKAGKLTDDEFAQMKNHVVQSDIILSGTPGISQTALDVAAQHHERYDGTGYPKGLKGDEISFFGQMAAIVDVYDAITSDRVYHKGMEVADALRKLFEWGKFHFNNSLVHTYIRTVGIYPVGSLVRLESGLLGVVVEAGADNLLLPLVCVVYDTKKFTHVDSYNMDLSKPDGGDTIVCHESPKKWNINTFDYLDIPSIEIN
jgi:HD-GYP domain-containing protein (c-di-GMP phosphodiesterase class II)